MMTPTMTLPRGAGTITYDARNTMNPYIARRYDHTTANGHPVYLYLGSYPNEFEAYFALKEASFKTNEELTAKKYTFLEVYEHLIKKTEQKKLFSYIKRYKTALKRCTAIEHMPYRDVTSDHMQQIINHQPTASTQARLRDFFRKLDAMAYELDIIKKCRSQFLYVISRRPNTLRLPFSDEEVMALLQRRELTEVKMVLVLLYTGFRIGELIAQKKDKVDLRRQVLVGGFKTAAGTNRVIPIHPTIAPIIEEWMAMPGDYLLPLSGGVKVDYKKALRAFYRAVTPIQERDHVPHETRHTFRTRLDDRHANEICINVLMGHRTPNPTDRIYCHKSVDQLREAILLLW